MPPKSADQLALESRAAMLKGEKKTTARINRLYAAAARSLRSELRALVRKIESADAAGLTVSSSWLYRQTRLLSLLNQIDGEISRFGSLTSGIAEQRQLFAVEEGIELAKRQLPESAGSFQTLPRSALEVLAARTTDGTPMAQKFGALGQKAVRRFEETLFAGVAAGRSSAQIGKDLADVLDISRTDAIRIARTEVLSAYRRSSIDSYSQMGVRQYRWLAAKDARTCPMCLALDGQVFDVATAFGTHPNCRCTTVPVREGARGHRISGQEWLDKQPEAVQDQVLGRSAGDLYRAGLISLDDFVEERQDPVYGLVRNERSLRSILALKDLRKAS